MAFKGTVLSVGELINRARNEPEPDWAGMASGADVRHRAADEAQSCARLLAAGAPLTDAWRFGILQTIDDYDSTVRRGGVELGRQVFDPEPPRTGSQAVDAAFAALAVYLGERDGWTPPAWAFDPERRAPVPWYPSQTQHPELIAEARRESPRAFLDRNVIVAELDLRRL